MWHIHLNDHHITPKSVKKIGNKETVRLCLICHTELHTILPIEKQSEKTYKEITMKWLSIIILLVVGLLIYFNL